MATIQPAHEKYTQLRNRLVDSIDELLTVDKHWRASGFVKEAPHLGLSVDELEGLKEQQRRLLSNQFSIALLSEFAGGKSTTVNALCGGIEFSVRGDGMVPTSSCVLRIRHDEEAAAAGQAEIEWRSDEQIYRVFRSILGGYPIEDMTKDGLIRPNILQQADVHNALEEEWGKYEKDKANYPNLDTLRVGRILLKACRDKVGVNRVRSCKTLAVTDVQDCIRFASRYERMNLDEVTPEKVKFLLIKEVRIPVNSPILKELGVEIVDCPGLNARTSDSDITRGLLAHADAVMTLISTDGKKISQSEIASLKSALQLRGGDEAGLFVCQNVKGQTFENFDKTLAGVNLDTLNDVGVEIKNLWNYHALIAHLALQGQRFLEGKLPQQSQERFIASCTQVTPQQHGYAAYWSAEINRLLGIAGLTSLEDGLTTENCLKVYEQARFAALTVAMKNFIVKRRGSRVLLNVITPLMGQVERWRKDISTRKECMGNPERKTLDDNENFLKTLEYSKQSFDRKADHEIKKVGMPRAVAKKYVDDVLRGAATNMYRPLVGKFLERKKMGIRFKSKNGQSFLETAMDTYRDHVNQLYHGFMLRNISLGHGYYNQYEKVLKALNVEFASEIKDLPGADSANLPALEMPQLPDSFEINGQEALMSEIVSETFESKDGIWSRIIDWFRSDEDIAAELVSRIVELIEERVHDAEPEILPLFEEIEAGVIEKMTASVAIPIKNLRNRIDGLKSDAKKSLKEQLELKEKFEKFEKSHLYELHSNLNALQNEIKLSL